MADLEDAGLIFSPHTSAGRLPTQLGLRFFVDALLDIGPLEEQQRSAIDARLGKFDRGHKLEEALTDATNLLSGLSQCAGVVITPKHNPRLKHIEFVAIVATPRPGRPGGRGRHGGKPQHRRPARPARLDPYPRLQPVQQSAGR